MQEVANKDKCSYNGVVLALCAKGAQDKWMEKSDDIFDARKQFLKGVYQTVYAKISTAKTIKKFTSELGPRTCLTFTLTRSCDLVNMLDLAIVNPGNYTINQMLHSIEVEFGGQRMDKLSVNDDIETQIKTNAALFGRSITHINGLTVIPLVLAPLHENNLVFPSSTHHELHIYVEIKKNVLSIGSMWDIELYGNIYMLNSPERNALFENPHEFITVQNQYVGADRISKGVNEIQLCYNHPIYLIYFWGMDKTKIKNVKLLLNKGVFFDGPLQILEHQKIQRGYGQIDPVIIFLSPDNLNMPTKCSVNFSRIDYAKLVIDTEEEDPVDVHIVGLNMQTLRYINGMIGLAYSK